MTVRAPWFIRLDYERGQWCQWPRQRVPVSRRTRIKVAAEARRRLETESAVLEAAINAAIDAEMETN